MSQLQEITQLMKGSGAKIDPKKPAIEVKKYTKKFKKFVSTDKVSFKVGHGVIHGFIGPNGSGKTTTIKALIGAYKATSGELLINGHKAGTEAANRLIGYIPERASFPKHLNSLDYLRSMGELSGLKPRVAKTRAIDILKALEMYPQAKRKPGTFSSGMQKKILLAQSLLTDPSILILDEPAANLDPSARKELFDQLIELRNQGKTILISSHILAELERIVDEVTFIYYGEMLYSGHVDDFVKTDGRVFIRTANPRKIVEFLNKKKYEWIGDPKTEIEIIDITRAKAQDLVKDLVKNDIEIISFRTNDLQTAYEVLAKNARINKKGKQTLDGVSTVNAEPVPADALAKIAVSNAKADKKSKGGKK